MGYRRICDCDSCGKPIPDASNNAHHIDIELRLRTPQQLQHIGRSMFDVDVVVCPDCFEFWKKATMHLIDTLQALKDGKMAPPPQLTAAPVEQLPEEKPTAKLPMPLGQAQRLGDGYDR